MIRGVFSVLVLALASRLPVGAQGLDGCTKPDAECVLDAAWAAALVLPEEKQDRVKPLFVTLAARTGDMALMQAWSDKLSSPPVTAVENPDDYIDFGWKQAHKVYAAYGLDGLIAYARDKREPLHYGRGNALLSAGKKLHMRDPQAGDRINQALIELAAAASDFERPELASAAAELAMVRCDLGTFDAAQRLGPRQPSLREAFWRARITGETGTLLARVVADAETDDTRHVRQALDGYGAILALGYCKSQ